MIPGITSFSNRAAMSLDPHWGKVWALLHMDDVDGSTTFTDSSSSPKTVTPTGNAKISTTQNKFGGSSAYFDGSGDWLDGPAITLVGDFTFEMFARFDNNTGDQCLIALGAGSDWGVSLYGGAGVRLRLREAISGSNAIDDVVTLIPDVWYHVAWVRYDGTMMLFLNGAQVGESYAYSATIPASSLRVGNRISNTNPFAGYMDEVRVTVDHARYTGPFSAPSKAFPETGPITPYDVYWDSVSLLTNGDSAVDLSSYSRDVTLAEGAAISTSQKLLGTGSFAFESSGSVEITSDSELYLDGDFCVEVWVRLLSQTNTYGGIIASKATAYGNGANLIYAGGAGAGAGAYRISAGGYALNTAFASLNTDVVSLDTWYHVALTRSGSTLRLFLDGVLQASSTFSGVFDLSAGGGSRIGRNAWDGSNGYLHGYVDDSRITKGAARYTANFTRPTAPFPSTGP